jgi:transcriptional regulator with XRE-family HTH domain
MKVGQQIKKMRELRNFTQDFVAEQVGISQAAYSDIEKDKTDVSLSRLSQIAKVLDVTLADIIAFDEKRVILNIQENKSSNNIFKNTTDTSILDKMEASHNVRLAEVKSMYESRLQDKDKEIERLSGLLSTLLHK